jgi:enoyl-CoA hydratase/carnithine racemase
MTIVQALNPNGELSMGLPKSLTAMRKDNIAILRLSRPTKRNMLDDTTVLGLQTFFRLIPPDIRAVVLHGEGEDFSAGHEPSVVVPTTGSHKSIIQWDTLHCAFQDVQFGRVPVVSVLHGAVVGAGLELAAATHIRVAERSAFYCLPEEQRGLFLNDGGLVRITRLIGVGLAQDMMLTGRVLSAEEGQAAGISQYLVDRGKGLVKAIGLATKIGTKIL